MLAARIFESALRCTSSCSALAQAARPAQTADCADTISMLLRGAQRSASATAACLTPPQPGGYLETGHAAGTELVAPRFLVTGASGQVGTELTSYLRERVGTPNVIASDVRSSKQLALAGPFIYCDVTNADGLARIVLENEISHVVHLATLLSAVGERNPQLALRVNTVGIQNVLDVAASNHLKVFAPSTIAVFGASTPKDMVPDDTICGPSTMYGVTKVHQELLGAYYATKFGVDFRSLRYPGIISACAPGGGTTDYAVEMYTAAARGLQYKCFIAPDTRLPMMIMSDCLRATWELMTAPRSALRRNTYNLTAMSFTPAELEASIRQHYPDFEVHYQPDFRQDIANSWPASVDDSAAREDWGWQHSHDLSAMTDHIFADLQAKAAQTEPRNDPVTASTLAQAAFV